MENFLESIRAKIWGLCVFAGQLQMEERTPVMYPISATMTKRGTRYKKTFCRIFPISQSMRVIGIWCNSTLYNGYNGKSKPFFYPTAFLKQCYSKATAMLQQGYNKATTRLHQGYSKARARLQQGYSNATARLQQGYNKAASRL